MRYYAVITIDDQITLTIDDTYYAVVGKSMENDTLCRFTVLPLQVVLTIGMDYCFLPAKLIYTLS